MDEYHFHFFLMQKLVSCRVGARSPWFMQTVLTALTLFVSPVAIGVSLESSVRSDRSGVNFRQHQSWESGQWWQWFSQFNAFSVPCFLAGLTVPRIHRRLYFFCGATSVSSLCLPHLPHSHEVGVLLTVAAFGFLTDRLSFPLAVAWIGFSL